MNLICENLFVLTAICSTMHFIISNFNIVLEIKRRKYMAIRFVWDDSFSVANSEIDVQHKILFDLANSLGDDLNQQRIKKIIMLLYKYTREHFTAEEKMMQRINYPKLKEHKELHEELITKLNTLSAQPFEDDESVYDFITFVYDWLTHHILNKDKDYMRFAQNQGIKNYDSKG